MSRPDAVQRLGTIVLAVSAAWLGSAPAGCAGASSTGSTASKASTKASAEADSNPWNLPETPTVAELIQRAKRPGRTVEIASPPASIAGDLAPPEDTVSFGEPGMSAAALIAALPPLPEPEAPVEISQEERDEALKLYAEGRAALRSGDLEPAVRALSASAAIDPNSGEAWLMLGEAQSARGGRSAAVRAYERAVDLGVRDPEALLYLAEEVGRRGDTARAASYYAAASQSEDEVVGIAARVGLAETMVEMGQRDAAFETLRDALAPFDAGFAERMGRTTAHREVLATLVRQAAGLWQTAGDLAIVRGQPAEALAAYRRAEELAPATDPALRDRVVYADVLLGNPSLASLELLGELWARGGQADPGVLEMIKYLSQAPSLKTRLGAAVAELSGELPGPMSPGSQVGLILAGAAAQPPEAAYETLRRSVERLPDEPELINAAIDTAGPDGTIAAERAAGLVGVAPGQAQRIALRLLRGDRPWAEIEPALGADDAETALLAAWACSRLGLHADAADRAEVAVNASSDADPTLRAAALAASVELSAKTCRYAESDLRLAELEAMASASAGAQRELGLAYSALGRHADAAVAFLAALNTADRPGQRRDLLVALGRSEAAIGASALAAERFEEALSIDPTDDAAYTGLIDLYRPGGALDDPDKLASAVARLRESSPNGIAFRWLVVQELVARRDLNEAVQQMVALLDEQDIEIDPLLRYLEAQRRLGRTAESIDWIGVKLEATPESEPLVVGLIQAEMLASDPQAAIEIADDWLRLRPSETVMQLRELALRRLNRAEEAEARLRERVAITGPTLANGIELADQMVALDDLASAAEILSKRAPNGPTRLTGEETDALNSVLRRASMRLRSAAQPASRRPADAPEADFGEFCGDYADLFDACLSLGLESPEGLDGLRLLAIASATELDLDRLHAVIRQDAGGDPAATADLWLLASEALVSAGRTAEAAELLRGALPETPNPEVAERAVRLTSAFSEPDRFEPLARELAELDLTAEVNSRLRPDRDINDDGGEGSVAECLYILGSYAMVSNRPEVAEATYRRVLEIAPRHPWANNDLGYALADEDRNLDESLAMITIAYEQLPGEASVIDSMGWVLYKLGRLRDGVDEDGNFTEGAVSLLEKAASSPDGKDNWEVLDHLGDARYLSGDAHAARSAWLRSKQRLDEILGNVPLPQPLPEAYLPYKEAQQRVTEKLGALISGLKPPVAASAAAPDI